MREIKFRAWDKENKFMFEIFDSTEHKDWFLPNWNGKYEVMQYTDLIDKNDREIYTGDIVKFNGGTGEVVFECGSFGIAFRYKEIDYDAMVKEFHDFTGCNNPLMSCVNDNFISFWEIYWNYNDEQGSLAAVEVIGNIYENPELLGGDGK